MTSSRVGPRTVARRRGGHPSARARARAFSSARSQINGCDAIGARLIANPNCTTAIAAMALWPLHCKYGIKRMIVSTYQAASGAGAEGMEELQKGIAEHVAGGTPVNKVFAHPLPFNLIPHIDKFQPNRYTKEEMKVAWETRKIFHADIAVSCTAVRVPTLRAHAEALTIEFARDVQAEAAAALLLDAPGCELVDNPAAAQYPMPINASNKHKVEVGRLRQSLVFGDRGEYRLQTTSFFLFAPVTVVRARCAVGQQPE